MCFLREIVELFRFRPFGPHWLNHNWSDNNSGHSSANRIDSSSYSRYHSLVLHRKLVVGGSSILTHSVVINSEKILKNALYFSKSAQKHGL
jgi:hypothetical protein